MKVGSMIWFTIIWVCLSFLGCNTGEAGNRPERRPAAPSESDSIKLSDVEEPKNTAPLDTALYNKLLLYLAHNRPNARWPVAAPYPLPGAVLPFRRVVAYYGNLYSKGMGILGELPSDEMLERLLAEVENWRQADARIPVVPALHYVAVTAQARPGKDGRYRLRMPGPEIEKVIRLANTIHALIFLDVQVGHSTLQQELPALEPYLSLANVHLGIDPEYSMKGGEAPCATIGSFDAADINYASSFLADVVRKFRLPPKILVVHRFTKDMVTNYRDIRTLPEVQIVINMDGFGYPAKKIDSYKGAVAAEPVQFTGFKLFYKNDIRASEHGRLMKPIEVLELYPSPVYIQYQ